MKLSRPSLRRGAALTLAAVALTVAGFGLGLRLAGPSVEQTELGRVSFEVRPSLGGVVDLYIPVADWGLRADALEAPFSLHAELRALDRQTLLEAADGSPTLLERVESDLADGARSAVIRAFAWGLATTAVLCALALALFRRGRGGRRFAGMVAGAALVLVAGSLIWARASFDAGALESPTYYAGEAELEQILAVASAKPVRSGYGSELDNVLRGISAVLSDAPPPESRTRDLTLGSDLHGNVLVVEPLARFLGGGPLVLAGDFGQRGTEVEVGVIAPAVAALGERIVAVSGNHDSVAMMRALAERGVTVLGEDGYGQAEVAATTEIEGLRVAGFPDPLEARGPRPGARDRAVTFEALPDPPERLAEAIAELRDWFDRLEPRPDAVVVHQNALAQSLAESLLEDGYSRPLAILTGHDHRQHVDRYGPITVVDGGTIGAGGVFDAGEEFAGFAELHFSATKPVLRSVDLIAVEPFSGRARASRVVIDSICPDEERCTFRPPEAELTLPAAGG